MLESKLTGLQEQAASALDLAPDAEALETVRVDILGRKGQLATLTTQSGKSMGKIPPEERASLGKLMNAVKKDLEARYEARKAGFERAALDLRLNAEWLDLTLPAPGTRPGALHPLTQIQRELEEYYTSVGFAVLDGPEVEDEWHNFDALNIPATHPARDTQDTFFVENGLLLRTHTSPVQVRAMEKFGAPLRMVAPGRVFRNEEVDASHEHTFYQLEGMMIDKDVSIGHMLYFMRGLLSAIFHRNATVRLRPGFFPFVEPGFELDIKCLICDGEGCPVCKQSGWVELLPCGLVHPNVLRSGGIDPEQWNGFAFGLGLTRLVMMRYGIDDIRHLNSGDLRFLRQF
jgi:phenylalanyl-tRNA synthetase alpha chain